MANNNRKTTIAIISLIITVVIIITAIVKGYTSLESDVAHQGKSHMDAIEMVKEEGCLPARESKIQIQLLQKDVKTILKKQDKSDIKQETMDGKLDELLRR